MKRKTSIQFLLVASCWLPMLAIGQVAPEIIDRFPAHIVYSVLGIADKTELTADRQMKLAQYFTLQDSLATKSLKSGKPVSTLNDFYGNQKAALKNVLSPIELNDYLTGNSNFTSQSSVVLKYRKRLNLDEKQIARVLDLFQSWGDQKVNETPDLRTKDSRQLMTILSPQQFDIYIAIANTPRALYQTSIDYQRATGFGLIDGRDSSQFMKEILDYRLQSYVAQEKASIDNSSETLDSLKKSNDAFQPLVLFKIAAFRGMLPFSELINILKYSKPLNLQSSQMDALFAAMRTLEGLRFSAYKAGEQHYSAKAFEQESLNTILDSTQLELYWVEKNREKAIINTKLDWTRLQQAGLIENADPEAVKREIGQYELDFLAATDRLACNKSQKNAFLKTSVENNKPETLKKLDRIDRLTAADNSARKNFAW